MKGQPTRVSLFLLLLPLLVAACGVPISDAEVQATAEGVRQATVSQETQLSAVMQASSLGSGQLAEVSTRGLVASPTPLPGTIVPSPSPTTPSGTATPTTTGTPATVTPTPSTTPAPGSSARLLTLDANGTPVATGTVAATQTPAATATPSPASTTTPSSSGTTAGGDVNELLRLLNEGRASLGLGQLRANATLASASTDFARYMATANFFSHNGLDGSTPERRVDAAGYSGNWRGETLAAGQPTAEAAFDVWWNKSPPHRAILVDPQATEVGIGFYQDPAGTYVYYWVLEVGTP